MASSDVRPLLTPFELGPVSLRNRVFVPGHTTNFGWDNQPTRRHAAYHAERARGGVGLIITEAVRVHPTSAGRHISLGSFDDASIPDYAAVAEAVHAEGARIFAQIQHSGRQAGGDAARTAAWAPGDVPWATGAHIPHAMGIGDIAVAVNAFGAAAWRMAQAGYDGVEVHLGHGHLLQQFLSPFTNHRTDAYGGTPDKRLRIVREVLAAVREQAPELPVGVRVSADEFLPGGLRPPDVVEILARLRAEFPMVYVHVSHSAYHGSHSLATQMADMSFGHAPFVHHARLFKREFPDLPVLAVCRLDSLPEAASLVAGGDVDLLPGGRLDGFDDVIVATGSRPGRRELPGGPPVYDLWQAVRGLDDTALLDSVLLLDDQGGWPAASVAEALARRGTKVHLVSPTASLSARITTYSKLALTDRLGKLKVKVHLLRALHSATGDRVTLRDTVNGDTETLDGITAIVDAWEPIAVDEIYRALDGVPGAPRVQVVGDANAPRTALEALYEGRLAGAFLTDPASGSAALTETARRVSGGRPP